MLKRFYFLLIVLSLPVSSCRGEQSSRDDSGVDGSDHDTQADTDSDRDSADAGNTDDAETVTGTDEDTVFDSNGGGDTALDTSTDLCPDDPNKTEPGECGCGVPEGTCGGPGQVLPSDVVLVLPEGSGPIIAPITAYNWRGREDWPDPYYELPIYKIIDRDEEAYWNYLVDELLLSRVDVVLMHGRGCWDLDSGTKGSGDLCPRVLEDLVDAVRRAGAEDVLRFGMWDDTGAYNKALQYVEELPKGTKLDISDRDNWEYFWDRNIKIWFDTIPQDWWYLMDDKPVIASWILKDAFFSNQQGNASALLDWLKDKFEERYSVEPAFVLDRTWFEVDSTITTEHATGMHGWFKPVSDDKESVYTYRQYNGESWGAIAPSFRDRPTEPGCGASCREVTRRDGATLNDALAAGLDAKLILLEGWTDMAESAGFYRSDEWRYPNQYINIVRRYADPEPETLRFQAEGADSFFDTTSGNAGDRYRNGDLDIGELDDGTGWFVGWTEAGEWFEYQQVELGCGTYRFTARTAALSAGKRIRLDLDGLASVTLPNTGDWQDFELVHLGETKLQAGTYDLRILFETGGVNLDWFFVKRADSTCD